MLFVLTLPPRVSVVYRPMDEHPRSLGRPSVQSLTESRTEGEHTEDDYGGPDSSSDPGYAYFSRRDGSEVENQIGTTRHSKNDSHAEEGRTPHAITVAVPSWTGENPVDCAK